MFSHGSASIFQPTELISSASHLCFPHITVTSESWIKSGAGLLGALLSLLLGGKRQSFTEQSVSCSSSDSSVCQQFFHRPPISFPMGLWNMSSIRPMCGTQWCSHHMFLFWSDQVSFFEWEFAVTRVNLLRPANSILIVAFHSWPRRWVRSTSTFRLMDKDYQLQQNSYIDRAVLLPRGMVGTCEGMNLWGAHHNCIDAEFV